MDIMFGQDIQYILCFFVSPRRQSVAGNKKKGSRCPETTRQVPEKMWMIRGVLPRAVSVETEYPNIEQSISSKAKDFIFKIKCQSQCTTMRCMRSAFNVIIKMG
ncbi:MAG: hypothetical protein LUF32_03160 [Clostridiales bacterium]|nr:hypothetical protein [Clostridiales bacterium]